MTKDLSDLKKNFNKNLMKIMDSNTYIKLKNLFSILMLKVNELLK